MTLEAKNINSLEDMQNFVEGCLNDFDAGISDIEETKEYMKQYTFKLLELCAGKAKINSTSNCTIFDISKQRELLIAFCEWIEESQPIAFSNMPEFVDEYFESNL